MRLRTYLAVSVVVALVHLALFWGSAIWGVSIALDRPSTQSPGTLESALYKVTDILLIPLQLLPEPRREFVEEFGLAVVVGNSILWGVAISSIAMALSRQLRRRRAAF